jgi:hypothetical protein
VFAATEIVRRARRWAAAAAAILLVLVALDLPLFDPGIHYGAVYDYYELEVPSERPVLCQGWCERQVPVWIYGAGTYQVHVGSDRPLWVRLTGLACDRLRRLTAGLRLDQVE